MTEVVQRAGGGLSALGSNPAAQLLASVPPPDDRPRMLPSRVSVLLSQAAGIDRRNIDPVMLQEWQIALAGLEFEECAIAIRLYRETEQPGDYLRPARVREHVVRLRADRRFDARVAEARRQIIEADQRKLHRPYVGPMTEAEFWAEQDADQALVRARELIELDDRMRAAAKAAEARGESPTEARRRARHEATRTPTAEWGGGAAG